MSQIPAEKAVKTIKDSVTGNYYLIGDLGIGDNKNLNCEEVDKCTKFIRKFLVKRETINKKYWSYWLKHRVEDYYKNFTNDNYVSNGAFILAMYLEGYEIQEQGVNAYFNASFKKLELAMKNKLL